jgi:signal transduction histidine kinase
MGLGFGLQQMVAPGLHYLGLARHQAVQQRDARVMEQLSGRIAGLLDVLDATPEAQRPAVITAAQRPRVHVRILDAPIPNLTNQTEPNADLLRLRRQIEAVLRVPRPIIVADRPADKQAGSVADHLEGIVFIEAALSDGHWLLFRSDLGSPPVDPVATKFSRARFAAWLSLSIVLGVMLSMLAARRLVKPLSELTAAVERIGGSGDAPPLPPRGPQEVRGTIEAVNRMQERLRRFNEDRTRMIAAMSHDLRTPLTRLRLRAELVEDQEQQQKMLRDLDMMGDMIESV